MNIKVSDVHETTSNAFGKCVYSSEVHLSTVVCCGQIGFKVEDNNTSYTYNNRATT
jgi:hypothetical protein